MAQWCQNEPRVVTDSLRYGAPRLTKPVEASAETDRG
jgi:hypothetical protein